MYKCRFCPKEFETHRGVRNHNNRKHKRLRNAVDRQNGVQP